MRLTTLFEDASDDTTRFPYRHGPFNSKNDVYRWFKSLLGNKSLYFGKGLQRNILKGHGGGQDAWYGFIRREEDGLFFYGATRYQYDAPTRSVRAELPQAIAQQPLSVREFTDLLRTKTEDEILAIAIERGITKKLGNVIMADSTIPEVLQLELSEYFNLTTEVTAPTAHNTPAPRMLRYDIDPDDFQAAVYDLKDDNAIADTFGITPTAAGSLRRELQLKFAAGRKVKHDRDQIKSLYESGMTDQQIATQLNCSLSTVSAITAPMRQDVILDMYKKRISPIIIADKVNLPLKVVQRIINAYKETINSRPWCKEHKVSYSAAYGCPRCREQ